MGQYGGNNKSGRKSARACVAARAAPRLVRAERAWLAPPSARGALFYGNDFPARLTPRQWLPRARLRLRRQLPPALRSARTCPSIRAPCSLLARGSSPRVPSVSDRVICNSVTVPCWVARRSSTLLYIL